MLREYCRTCAAMLIVCLPMAAQAGREDGVQLDVFYLAQSNFEVEADGERDKDKGDGLGARLQVPVGANLRFTGEWQNADLDDTGWIVEQGRGGLVLLCGSSIRFGLGAEYVRLSIDTQFGELKTKGYNAFGRGEFDASERVVVYGQLGYIDLEDDADGSDFLLGASLRLSERFGAFGELRSLSIEDDTNVQIDMTDYRLGVRASIF